MESFDGIYKESVQKVYHFLLRLTENEELAEELTSETFYQAFLHIGQFRGECSMDTWLCQIAKNAYYKELRRRQKLRPEDTFKDIQAKDYYKDVENRDMALSLHKILHQLENPYKEVFSLRVFGELQFKEIASVFGKSESWAKMTYYRAKAKIIAEMEVWHGKEK